jgi:hypothetical protein
MVITETQKDRLTKLNKIARDLDEQMETLFQEALTITKEDSDCGFTFDFIYNDFGTVEELIERLNKS